MALNFKQIFNGLRLKAKAVLTSDTKGELEVLDSDGKLYYHDGTTRAVISSVSSTDTITNKTIDASLNTITNLTVTNLAAGVLDTDLTTVAGTNTTIPSALAVKTYVDAGLAAQNQAIEITYDNTTSGLTATNVQAALDEIDLDLDFVQTILGDHIADTVGAHAASAISVIAQNGITSIEVQAALEELQAEILAGGNGDVFGPASSTDNAITRFDGTTGKTIQNSTVTLSDTGVLAGASIDGSTNTITNITSTMLLDDTIVNADINTAAAIDRSKLAAGIANAVVHNDASGVMSNSSDLLVGTNSLILANTKHLELQAQTDAATTGTNASLAAFTAGGVRITNASLVSLANIPAGANGQEFVLFNRTGVEIIVVDSSAAIGTAANRILTGTSADITLDIDAALILSYDSTSARWQVVGGSGGSNDLTGAITSVGSVTSLGSFSSANLSTALTDETGTGLAVFNTSPTLVTPALGTPTSVILTNATGLPISTGVSGLGTGVAAFLATPSSANLITAVTDETGTGSLVFATSPVLVTPNIGAANGTSLVLGGTIDANAILDVQSTTKAFLPPRMTTAQKNAIASPTAGMQVYDTTLNSISYYNGTSWISLLSTVASVTNATSFSAQVSITGVVSGENLDWINGNCTDANPSVCTFNTSIFTVAPNCTTTATDTANNLAVTVPATSTSTSVTIQQNSSIVATRKPFVVHCQKSGADYVSAISSGVVASTLIGYVQVPGITSGNVDMFSVSYGTTNSTTICTASPCSYFDQIGTAATSVTRPSLGTIQLNTVRTYTKLKCVVEMSSGVTGNLTSYGGTSLSCSSCNAVVAQGANTAVLLDHYGTFMCQGTY